MKKLKDFKKMIMLNDEHMVKIIVEGVND